MVIHALDMACSEDVNAALVGGTNSYVSTWLTNYTAWEPDGDLQQDNEPPSLVPLTAAADTRYYYGGPWRFAWSEDKSLLTSGIVDYFQTYDPTWWRIRWHECDHDEDTDRRCDWATGDVWTGGTPPESDLP